ncbi:MAG TPA: Xaa-Pro aminopeptidase [Bryobacteraceae bacterium]|nr:Xaa-Pro aminopeptidase [Bryobacteraceae bacterium]
MITLRSSGLLLAAAGALSLYAADSSIWKVTPPPPASRDAGRVADLSARRKAMAEHIGPKGILILYAAEPRNYAGDVDWPYRQENNFFYLTGINQTGNALVMIPGATRYKEILFMAPSNPSQESWTGHLLLPDEARSISGIDTVWDARQLPQFLATLVPDAKSVFMPEPTARGGRGGRGAGGGGRGMAPAPPPAVDFAAEFKPTIDLIGARQADVYMISQGRPAEYSREIEIAGKLAALNPPIAVKNPSQIFGSLRKVKSQRELDLLQHAVDITGEAFQRAYALGTPGTPEYEIQAQFEFTFLRRDAHWGYPCIVASGTNATTLHYESNKDTIKPGDLLLMDDAAEYDGYSVDVTRTIPVSGKFTKEQADIYRMVWEAQQAGFAQALPGHTEGGRTADTINGAVTEVFKKGLFKLGLITDPNDDAQVRIWFNHGVGHGIGLNVHDLSTGQELQPGMTVTIEPGIYIRPDVLDNLPKNAENEKFIATVKPAFEKYKGIGVRIEDDVLITNGKPTMMSAAIPSKLEDVEADIAELRKAVKTAPPR